MNLRLLAPLLSVASLAVAADAPAPETAPGAAWPAEADAALDALLGDLGLERADLAFPRDLAETDLRLAAGDRALRGPVELLGLASPWVALAREAPRLPDEGALAFLAAGEALELLGVERAQRYELASPQSAREQLQQLNDVSRAIGEGAPAMTQPWSDLVGQLAVDAGRARDLAGEALASLSLADRQRIVAALPALWFQNGETVPGAPPPAPPLSAAPSVAERAAVLALGERLDRATLARAAGTLLIAADAFLSALPGSEIQPGWRTDVVGAGGLAVGPFLTPAGPVYLGGPGPNRWRLAGAVIIDFGGDDVYEAPRPPAPPETGAALELIIDMAGNDTYRADAWGCFGGAVLGLSLLRDLGGDDTYEGAALTQGAAWFGAGLLLDRAGNDTYRAAALAQGAAGAGIGLLADAAGRDAYTLAKLGQGFGTTLGVGVLADRAGADVYRAGGEYVDQPLFADRHQSLAQGMGLGHRYEQVAGGVGVLWDAAGNDVYAADVYGQGVGYWYATGLFVDGGGHDSYTLGQYGQGAGIHMGSGALVDVAGDDQRTAEYGPAQGAAHDLAVGALVDMQGNDLAVVGGIGQGQGHANGVALYADLGGDDVLAARDPAGAQGTGSAERGTGSVGLLLDLGGKDRYAVPEAGDDRTWARGAWGGGLDRGSAPAGAGVQP
ncbi:MAG: hypothetical protein KBD01_00290 [Acidobacteria bacterium]|nr:hypothetical protein [Acidobacteriota bacterium]